MKTIGKPKEIPQVYMVRCFTNKKYRLFFNKRTAIKCAKHNGLGLENIHKMSARYYRSVSLWDVPTFWTVSSPIVKK